MDNYLTSKEFLYWTRELLEREKKSVKMNPHFSQENSNEYLFLKTRQKEDFVAWTFFDNSENRNYFYTYLFHFLRENNKLKELSDDRRFFDEFYTSLINSYNSLFEVTGHRAEGTLLKDLISGELVLVRETSLIDDKEERFFLLRLATYRGDTYIIQVLNSMSASFATLYSKNLSEYFDSDFSKAILQDPAGVHAFLKSEAFPVFYIYSQTLQDYIQVTEELADSNLYGQMLDGMFDPQDEDLFRTFLNSCRSNAAFSQMSEEDIYFHFFNIFMDYLFETPLNFSSISELDFEEIFEELCRKGSFVTVEHFTDSLALVKSYYQLRLSNYPNHHLLVGLSRVSDRLFRYRKLLHHSWNGYFYNEHLVELATDTLKDIPSILLDFEKFMDFATYETLSRTTKGEISSHTLQELGKIFSLNPTRSVTSYTTHHYPYLELMLHFALSKDIFFSHGKEFEIHANSYRYTELPMDVKCGIWIQTLQQEDFFLSFMRESRYFEIKQFTISLLQALSKHQKVKHLSKEEQAIVEILHRMGLIQKEREITLTAFGKAMVKYFNEPEKGTNVIALKDFQKH